LPEILVGVIFLLSSGLIYAQAVLPAATLGFRAAVVGFALFLPVAIFCSQPLLKQVRHHYLIERSGFVQYKPVPRKFRSLVLPGLAVLAVFATMAFVLPPPGNWLLAVTGILGGLLASFSGRQPRLILGGAVMALAGVSLTYTRVGLPVGMAILFALQGVVEIVLGGVTLARFLSQTDTSVR
jgi:hypothetical protein